MSEWKEYKLGELIADDSAELQTGSFGTMPNASKYVLEGTPVIAVQDIGENKLVYHKFVFADESTVQRLSKYQVKENDIIFGRKGAVERRASIKKQEDSWLQCSYRIQLRFFDKVDPVFASYQFGTNYYQEWMFQNAGGATMPSFNQSVLKELPIRITNLNEQRTIASVLSSLKYKIDLHNCQNATLKKTAETLFRQWFMEEAKEQWEAVELGTVVETTSGGTPSRSNMTFYENGTINRVKLKELNGSLILETEEMNTEGEFKKSSAKILPENSILIATYEVTIGEYAIISKEITCNQAICALKSNKDYSSTYLFLLIKSNKEELINMAVGSGQQNISQLLIKQLPVLNCSGRIKEFNLVIEPYFEKIKSNQT